MTDTVTDVLFDRGTLVDLHVGKPTFQKKLRQSDLLVNDIDPKVIYLGHKKLIPPKAMERLITLEGKARLALADRSLPFPISGARFVNVHTLPEVMRTLSVLRTEWRDAVDDLVREYPQLKEQQLRHLDEQNVKLVENELQKYSGLLREEKQRELAEWVELQKSVNRSLYPPDHELAGLFKFVWRMFKVSPTAQFDELSELTQQELLAAQEQLRRDLQVWVRQASADLHRALGEAALNASQLLEKHKKLNPRNLKPLFDAFETFKAVDFTGTSDFRRVVDEVRARFVATRPDGTIDYELTSESVNGSEMAQQAFQGLLTNIANLAQDDVAANVGLKALAQAGEFGRVLEI